MLLRLIVIIVFFMFSCREQGRLERAQNAFEVGDYKRAVLFYNEVLDENPLQAEARYGLALSYFEEGKRKLESSVDAGESWEKAQREFDILSKTDSTIDVKKWHSLCLFYLAKETLVQSPEQSLLYLQKSLEQNEQNTLSMNLKALILKEIGEMENAVLLWKKAVEIRPQFEAAWLHLGHVYWDQGQKEEAYIHWQLGLDENPSSQELERKVERAKKALGL